MSCSYTGTMCSYSSLVVDFLFLKPPKKKPSPALQVSQRFKHVSTLHTLTTGIFCLCDFYSPPPTPKLATPPRMTSDLFPHLSAHTHTHTHTHTHMFTHSPGDVSSLLAHFHQLHCSVWQATTVTLKSEKEDKDKEFIIKKFEITEEKVHSSQVWSCGRCHI